MHRPPPVLLSKDSSVQMMIQLCSQIKTGRMAQFREWLQDSIVAQSQSFPGYNGTVVFVPPGKAGQSKEGTICVAEVRYLGAQNLRCVGILCVLPPSTTYKLLIQCAYSVEGHPFLPVAAPYPSICICICLADTLTLRHFRCLQHHS